jgi:AcrR family transcriptional regulator
MQARQRAHRTYNSAFRQEQARATRRRILDAARRLFASRGYAGVTMRDVATAAGVAVQTVHAVFGTKLSLAEGIVGAALEDVNQEMQALIEQATQAQDLRVSLYTVGAVARLAYERFGDVLLFLHDAGDPQLIAEAERFDRARFEVQSPIAPALARAGLLRPGLSAEEGADLIWALSSPEWYGLLVRRRGWDPNRWQQTVGDALVHVLLRP